MSKEKGGGLVLSSLADRQVVASGTQLLATDYNVHNLDYPSTWSLDDFEFLGQRGIEMEWLEQNLPEIKDRLLKVIRGQVSWEKMKAELFKAGFKGAADIKQSTIDALIEEQRTRAKGLQQDYRLTANTRKFSQETTEVNSLTDSLIEIDLQSLRAKNAATLEQRRQAADAGDAEAIAAWDAERKVNDLEAATMLLKFGTAARSHPKFPGGVQAIGGSSRQQAAFGGFGGFGGGRQQPKDRLKIELEGNVAGSVNRVAHRAGNGLKKMKNFFFGG